MKAYETSAQALVDAGITDAMEMADNLAAGLLAEGFEMLEITQLQVINGKLWYVVQGCLPKSPTGAEFSIFARLDEGTLKIATSRTNAYKA